MSTKKPPSEQYQVRLTRELREQIESEARKDGDSTVAAWIKRIVRKELISRGIDPLG
jgi:predicted HicB family RNase H-like nuclease